MTMYTDAIDLLTGTVSESSVGVTTTTTGNAFDVSKRDTIVIQFLVTNHGSGNTVFSVDGSNDGTHWTTGLAVQDLQSTNSTTYVNSKTISSNTSVGVKVPNGWRFIRAVATITTDGTSFAFMESSD